MDLKALRSFILVTFGLVTLALSQHKGVLLTTPLKASFSSNLRCDEALKIVQWGEEKHGGTALRPLDDKDTVEKALTLFVDKLDPYKILFTSSEVSDFKDGARKQWQGLLKSHSCSFFSAWIQSSYPQANSRLEKTVENSFFNLPNERNAKRKEPALTKFKEWAKNAEELKRRVIALGTEALRSSPTLVIEAYKGRYSELVLNSLYESALPEVPATAELIAKSILGTFDPYSTYFSHSEFDDFYADLSGGTSGIGIRIRKIPTGLLVEDVLKEGAAFRSGGIEKNDVITRVDGVETSSLSMNQIKQILKGPESSKVKLQVQKKPTETRTVELTRSHFDFEEAKISSKSIASSNGTAVKIISLPNFYGNAGFNEDGTTANSSAEDLRKVLETIVAQKKAPEALVLDLRGNPGGFLEEAVSIASFFLGNKPVVGVAEKENTRVLRVDSQEPIYRGPLVVLVDSGTASAAEVLAGALSDLQRAIVVGSEHTYGKGSVQKLFSLDDSLLDLGLSNDKGNGVLKLTTSIFYSPLGHTPANGGLKSHIALPESIMTPKEDYGTAPHIDVPESKPLLDTAALMDLELQRNMQEGLLNSLKELSASRLKLQGSNTRSEDDALSEAAQIASDLLRSSPKSF